MLFSAKARLRCGLNNRNLSFIPVTFRDKNEIQRVICILPDETKSVKNQINQTGLRILILHIKNSQKSFKN